ncbi:hypothetical protein CHA01nite_36910 [Chryseobacterium hagamense]|uniref:Uncharacterized protein n=2 Tax=Chryseobacterium hagamense TaxID=395935 RepID=A0A511YRX9_9FLAO|nr:hypothetical protein CHA01nite_36910 [Chryseobacterium hagamense]
MFLFNSCTNETDSTNYTSIETVQKVKTDSNQKISRSITLKFEVKIVDEKGNYVETYNVDLPVALIEIAEKQYSLDMTNLEAINTIDEKTKKAVKLYVPKKEYLNANRALPFNQFHSIESGYGDDGYGCLVYGHYIYADNGLSLFQPCKLCVGFSEICPPEGGAFV